MSHFLEIYLCQVWFYKAACDFSGQIPFRVVFSVWHSLKLWHCAIISNLQQSTIVVGELTVTVLESLLCNAVQCLHIMDNSGRFRGEVPNIPNIANIPDIPNIPNISNIPKIPNIPNIPKIQKIPKKGEPDLKRARPTGLSAPRTKWRGPKGLQLEVGAQRAPRLLVHNKSSLCCCNNPACCGNPVYSLLSAAIFAGAVAMAGCYFPRNTICETLPYMMF